MDIGIDVDMDVEVDVDMNCCLGCFEGPQGQFRYCWWYRSSENIDL